MRPRSGWLDERSRSSGDQNATSSTLPRIASPARAERTDGINNARAPAPAQIPPPATSANSGTIGISKRKLSVALATLGVTAITRRSASTATTTKPSSASPQPLRRELRKYCSAVPTATSTPAAATATHASDTCSDAMSRDGVTIAGVQTSAATIQPSTHGLSRGRVVTSASTLCASSQAKPTRVAHKKPVPNSAGPISETSCAEYSGTRGIAPRMLLKISGPAPNVFCSKALRARSPGARASSTPRPTNASSTSPVASSAYLRPESVNRRLSGIAPASRMNGANITAALSLVNSSRPRHARPSAPGTTAGRRMNATSDDRYTRHRNVAWLSVQKRQASSWNSGTAISNTAPTNAAERVSPIWRPSTNVIGTHSALKNACMVRPTVSGSQGNTNDSAADSTATDRPSTPRSSSETDWPDAQSRARSRAWTAYRYSSEVGSPARLFVV